MSTPEPKKTSNLGVIASVAVIAILVLAFAYTYTTDNRAIGNLNSATSRQASVIGAQSSTIEGMSSTIAAQGSTITSQSSVISSQSSQVSSLNGQVLSLDAKVAADQTSIASLQSTIISDNAQIAQLEAQSNNPTLVIWNVQDTFGGGYFLFEGVPDTFDYQDSWTATAPVTVYYFSDTQFSDWYQGGSSLSAVSGTYYSIGPSYSSSDTFTLAEGCGGYVAIYTTTASSVTITPNVSVTYNPASSATGSCA